MIEIFRKMIEMFGKKYDEIGSSDRDLILKTSGKIKIQWGKKLIDLLDSNGNLNVNLSSIIKKVSSDSNIKEDGFYLYNNTLLAKVGSNVLELSSGNGNTYVSFLAEQEASEDEKYKALQNIGFIYPTQSSSNIYPKNGIIYIEDSQSLFIVNDGNLTQYSMQIPNPYKKQFVIAKENDETGSLYIEGEGNKNSLMFNNLKIYSNHTTGISVLDSSDPITFYINNKGIATIDAAGVVSNCIRSQNGTSSSGFRILKLNNKYQLDVDKVNVRELIKYNDSLANQLIGDTGSPNYAKDEYNNYLATIEVVKQLTGSDLSGILSYIQGLEERIGQLEGNSQNSSYIHVNTNYISFDYNGSTAILTITSNVSWDITVTYYGTSSGWCNLNSLSGTNNKQIIILPSRNELNEQRTARITISGDNNTVAYVDVVQGYNTGSGTGQTTQPVVLDDYLNTYNNKLFNASISDLQANFSGYNVGEPIRQNSSLNGGVYDLLLDATDYYNDQYDNLTNNLVDIFDDQVPLESDGYEITTVDKGCGFGWFLAYLLNALYPFVKAGSNDVTTGYKHRMSDVIFKIAFEEYSEVNQKSEFSYSNINGSNYLSKYGGALLASIIFARMFSDNSNTGFLKKFTDLKATTYTNRCFQSYHFNDGEKFLYQDTYIPKVENIFPKPPVNGTNNWIWRRDVAYHDIGGQHRGESDPLGKQSLDDRKTNTTSYVDRLTGTDNTASQIQYSSGAPFTTINRPSVKYDKNALSWQDAIKNDNAGFGTYYDNNGNLKYRIGYNKVGCQRYCLLDLSRKAGNRISERLKGKATHNGSQTYIWRNRPVKYYIQNEVAGSGNYVSGGWNNDANNPIYYYDNDGASENTAGLKEQSSYPSGHAAMGWNMALVFCASFPQFASDTYISDLKKLFKRTFQYCQNRTILGAHWQFCVDMGRLGAAICFSQLFANEYFITQLKLAQAE